MGKVKFIKHLMCPACKKKEAMGDVRDSDRTIYYRCSCGKLIIDGKPPILKFGTADNLSLEFIQKGLDSAWELLNKHFKQ